MQGILDAMRNFSNSGITLNHFIALSMILFLIGLYGVLTRRNLIAILMSVEIMLNAAMLNFVAVSAYTDPDFVQGHIFALFVVAMAAAEVAVGLAIFINVFRSTGGVTPESIKEMRG
jgi:NAD(P)H-quinone oxidoreductase subunit 4L